MKGLLQPLLYLAISGLVLGFGYQIYELSEFKNAENAALREQRKERNQRDLEVLLAEAEDEVGAGTAGDVNYAASEWWDAMTEANYHGYVPPPPPEPKPEGEREEKPVEIPKTPLEDLFDIEALYYDIRFEGGNSIETRDLSRISIRYKPAANVQPPAGFEAGGESARSSGPGDAVRRPGSSRSTSRSAAQRSRPRPSAFPAAAANGQYPHILRVGDTLWEPHSNIRLVRVDESANFAYFVREDPNEQDAEPKEEKVARPIDGLNLDQETLSQLYEAGIKTGVEGDPATAAPTATTESSTGWQDVEQTTLVQNRGETRVNFARNDPVLQNPAEFFNDRVGTRTFNRNGRRGVQVTTVPSGASQTYGVETGDILISLNGVEVGSRAEAMRVGRRQYDQGRRTFEAVILRNGRQVTQTYVAPEN